LVASPGAKEGSVDLHADARVYAGLFAKGEHAELPIAKGRAAWVHIARGKAKVNGNELSAGDALALEDEKAVQVEGVDAADVLVFDLA
jgi:redox-sensitive bicupin YhaK (pirin superfamily)